MGAILADELEFLAGLVPVAGTRVLDVGCGDGAFARRLLIDGCARQVTALEGDPARHAANLRSRPVASLVFLNGEPHEIPLPSHTIDLAVMLRSLHHFPVQFLDAALREVRRVLVEQGYLYVSEPLYAGEFNEVVRLFHDEGMERAGAYAAMQRACGSGGWDCLEEQVLDAQLAFRDFDQFMDRMVHHSGLTIAPEILPAVRERFERSMTPAGALFIRHLRIHLLRKR